MLFAYIIAHHSPLAHHLYLVQVLVGQTMLNIRSLIIIYLMPSSP